MTMKRCFKQSCELEVDYACKCSDPVIYSCSFHFGRHLKLMNRTHIFESILLDLDKEAKDTIKGNLEMEKSKNVKKRTLTPQRHSKNKLKRKKLVYDPTVSNLCSPDSTLNSNQIGMGKPIFEEKDRPNSPETKQIHLLYQSQDLALNTSSGYQENSDTCHKAASLYLFHENKIKKTQLLIYDIENEKEKLKTLKTPEPLGNYTCIALLPNSELFCYGNSPASGIALIIDSDYKVRKLPSGIACKKSSAIYFNKNIYCFGGWRENCQLTLSRRFDLDLNRWMPLTPIPYSYNNCSSIIVNGNIMIAGLGRDILLYSVNIDSFSFFQYSFAPKKARLLASAKEKLFLIENIGSIYESKVGNEYDWKLITNSAISNYPYQSSWAYSKGCIYIGCIDYNFENNNYESNYYKFSLDEKSWLN